ncbi:MAG TPA: hypothetical protein VGR53_08960 [Nitrososphaerales archaeon]|nr:hypothetical protein [Nitrososphaerales archaeon]
MVAGLFILMFAGSSAWAFTLTNPPAPNTTVNGPLKGPPPVSSFTGGVLLQQDQSSDPVEPHSDFLAKFECVAGTQIVSKTIPSQFGQSIQGPISSDQTQGIIDAIKSVRPPKAVTLSTTVSGAADVVTTWTLTGIKFHETSYNVYVITQASPAIERLVGYIQSWVPEALITNSTTTPCPTPAPIGTVTIGDGWDHTTGPAPPETPSRSFFDVFFGLPDDSWFGIIQYGRVNVYSGGMLAGSTDVRPGETVMFELPAGSYDVQADIGIFGLHFPIPGGSFSSGPADFVILSVTLSAEEFVYGIIIVMIVLVVLVVVWALRHFVFKGGKGAKGVPRPVDVSGKGTGPPPDNNTPDRRPNGTGTVPH